MAWKLSELNRSALIDLNTGAATEGRRAAQKHPGTRRGEINTAESKVTTQDTDSSIVDVM